MSIGGGPRVAPDVVAVHALDGGRLTDNPHERRGLAGAAREASEFDDSFVPEVLRLAESAPMEWSVGSAPDDEPVWIYVEPAREKSAVEAGWKLHVSAALVSADEVLRRAASILLRDRAPFKIAASLRVLEALNEGEASLSQVGKFITVYPENDDHAVDLALELHDATKDLRAPPVLSDRALVPGSLVHYRYGSFAPPESTGNGTAPNDPYAAGLTYSAPEGIEDPFVARGIAALPAKGLVADRYYISSTMHRSPRGAVYTAIDLKDLRDCIVKRAWRDARLNPDGTDARDQLRAEAGVLERLRGKGPFPEVLDLVEYETDLLLIMERVPGSPLAAVVHRLFDAGRPPSAQRLTGWARQLAAALGSIHEEGLVYRDLNPENVIARRDGSISLVDFELATEPGEASLFYTAGTPGFLSPQQAAGEPAAASDDIYSLGAIIVFAAIGSRPSGAADIPRMAKRLGETGGVTEGLVRVAERCLGDDASQRWPDAAAVEAELSSISAS